MGSSDSGPQNHHHHNTVGKVRLRLFCKQFNWHLAMLICSMSPVASFLLQWQSGVAATRDHLAGAAENISCVVSYRTGPPAPPESDALALFLSCRTKTVKAPPNGVTESDISSNTCRHLAPAGQRACTRGSALLTRTGALQQAGRMLRQSQRSPTQNPSVGRDPRWDISLCSGCNRRLRGSH